MNGALSRFCRAVVIVALGAVAPLAIAAPCSGFTDVEDTSPFCPNVDWLKNRAITLGCTSATLYCPLDSVSRLSMAAFMNRLGTALTPTVLYDESTGAALDLEAAPPALCATEALAASPFPRSVQLSAALTAQTNAVAAGIDLTLVQSINNGASWTALNALPASIAGSDRRMNASVLKGDVPLAAGTAYRFGLRVTRTSGTGTAGDLLAWTCQLKAVVTSRTGASAPF